MLMLADLLRWDYTARAIWTSQNLAGLQNTVIANKSQYHCWPGIEESNLLEEDRESHKIGGVYKYNVNEVVGHIEPIVVVSEIFLARKRTHRDCQIRWVREERVLAVG